MVDVSQIASNWLGVIVLFIAGLGVFFRLEAKVKTVERDLNRLYSWRDEQLEARLKSIEDRHINLDNRVMEKLSDIEKMVARIEGKLEHS